MTFKFSVPDKNLSAMQGYDFNHAFFKDITPIYNEGIAGIYAYLSHAMHHIAKEQNVNFDFTPLNYHERELMPDVKAAHLAQSINFHDYTVAVLNIAMCEPTIDLGYMAQPDITLVPFGQRNPNSWPKQVLPQLAQDPNYSSQRNDFLKTVLKRQSRLTADANISQANAYLKDDTMPSAERDDCESWRDSNIPTLQMTEFQELANSPTTCNLFEHKLVELKTHLSENVQATTPWHAALGNILVLRLCFASFAEDCKANEDLFIANKSANLAALTI